MYKPLRRRRRKRKKKARSREEREGQRSFGNCIHWLIVGTMKWNDENFSDEILNLEKVCKIESLGFSQS